jgi:hypothetical protein
MMSSRLRAHLKKGRSVVKMKRATAGAVASFFSIRLMISRLIRTVVEAVGKMQKPADPFQSWDDQGVSQIQLAGELGRDQSVISRHVRRAVGQGFLKDLTPGQGRKATLVIGDRELPSGTVLPAPEELENEEELELV